MNSLCCGDLFVVHEASSVCSAFPDSWGTLASCVKTTIETWEWCEAIAWTHHIIKWRHSHATKSKSKGIKKLRTKAVLRSGSIGLGIHAPCNIKIKFRVQSKIKGSFVRKHLYLLPSTFKINIKIWIKITYIFHCCLT